jgi:hypothetical protein
MWRNLEQQVGVAAEEGGDPPAETLTPADNIAGMIRRGPKRHGRRVFRSSYLG